MERYEGQIDNILSVHVENESATRKLAKKAMKKFCSAKTADVPDRIVNARVYAAQIIADNEVSIPEPGIGADCFENDGVDPVEGFDINVCMDDEFALNVMLELAEQLKFSKEQLDQFARAEPPKDFEEAMTRPDAKLYELATAVELSAFDKYDVIRHNVSRGELTVRGIDGKTIPMQLLFEVKRNEDGSYLKHKCRCILLGHQGFLTARLDFEETYAPAPEHFSNLFLQAYALTQG